MNVDSHPIICSILWVTLSMGLLGCPSDGTDSHADVLGSEVADTEVGPDSDVTSPSDGQRSEVNDGADTVDDTDDTTSATVRFEFATDPTQPVSKAPFPMNLYRGSDGIITLSNLAEDPIVGGLAKPELLSHWTDLANTRSGFGIISPVYFFMDGAPDPDSFIERVRMVTLEGPEAGRMVTPEVRWLPYAQAVAVAPAPGDYWMADSTYAVFIERGVTAADGGEVLVPEAFAPMLEVTEPTDDAVQWAWETFAPLRAWLDASEWSSSEVLVATVFTTEAVWDYTEALFDAADLYELPPVSSHVAYDALEAAWVAGASFEGAELDLFFGVFESDSGMPMGWLHPGNRGYLGQLLGLDGPYQGGIAHPFIAKALHGTVSVPAFAFEATATGGIVPRPLVHDEGGLPTWALESSVPFTLFLCEGHLSDSSNVPVAIYSHGGGSIRSQAVGYANANCQNGVATIAIDMLFHGGRGSTMLVDGTTIAPTGEEGFVADQVGDAPASSVSVANLFGIGVDAEPRTTEALLLSVSVDTYTLMRHLKEGDWSEVMEGLSFDGDAIFHQGLSFGSSLHTPLMAHRDFLGLMQSVGTGALFAENLLVAPANALQAAGIAWMTFGLTPSTVELQTLGWFEVGMALSSWLHQKGDPLVHAPYVLRHRPAGAPVAYIGSHDGWDNYLSSMAQQRYVAAIGAPVYTHGDEWTPDPTIPGVTLHDTQAYESPLSDNMVLGDRTYTAARFFLERSCHSLVEVSVCVQLYADVYPPVVMLDEPVVTESPVCAIHAQAINFMGSLLDDTAPVTIIAPEGDCASVYDLP
jgi:hypothetical protein